MKKSGQFLKRIKFVKISDILSFFPMLVGLIASFPLRLIRKNVWLVCERKNEARDNGYWFFRYLRENHKEVNAVYAINKKSKDYKKVCFLGKTIQFGSVSHWAYYFASKWNISSQKEGKPNAAVCFVLEVIFGLRKNRIYLKHGIVKDSQKWIYYDVSKMTMICCASKREQEFIQKNFGYEKSAIKLVGLARYDNLPISGYTPKKQILIMPTMREWLKTISSDTLEYEKSNRFEDSEFFVVWNKFLKNARLNRLLKNSGVKILFYLHPAMQKYTKAFMLESPFIEIATDENYDIQQLLIDSSLLITDYSSVFFDFAYMDKPLIYFQFDYERYRQGQYQEGYFSYEKDGFGPVNRDIDSTIDSLERAMINGFKNEQNYSERARLFFSYRDNNNCSRIYKAIEELNR